jgi:hypothetical protein
MVHAQLYRVLRHRQPSPQKLDIAHTQGDRFAPPHPAVGQHQHKRPVLAGLVGQSVHVIGGQVDMAAGRLARQVFHPPWLDGSPPYVVRWLATCHVATVFPGPDAIVVTPEEQQAADERTQERAAHRATNQ